MLPLLERCTRELQDNAQYKDDVRYLRVWIQYVRDVAFLLHSIPWKLSLSTAPVGRSAVRQVLLVTTVCLVSCRQTACQSQGMSSHTLRWVTYNLSLTFSTLYFAYPKDLRPKVRCMCRSTTLGRFFVCITSHMPRTWSCEGAMRRQTQSSGPVCKGGYQLPSLMSSRLMLSNRTPANPQDAVN